MIDYPASHSMDTEWFAIDKDGNIGVFDSGENGAVPDSSYRVERLGDLFLKLAEKSDNRVLQWNIPGENIIKNLTLETLQNKIDKVIEVAGKVIEYPVIEYPIGSTTSGMTTKYVHKPLEEQMLFHWRFLLSSDNVIPLLEIEKIENNYAVHFAGEPSVIHLQSCRVIVVKKLMEEGLILAGKEIENFTNEFHTLFGFFSYVMNYDEAYPYEKAGKPVIPLILDDLPEDIRDAISQTRFNDFSFNERTTIQPIEHFPCNTWSFEQLWIDSEGNEREGHPYE
ncbi:MAG: hypothetical protein AB4062_21310 [Crocosphaera sp.]